MKNDNGTKYTVYSAENEKNLYTYVAVYMPRTYHILFYRINLPNK